MKSAAKFKIEGPIEHLVKGARIEVIDPGEHVLTPGVYRFADSVGVYAINVNAGQAQIAPVPEEKSPWPDPLLLTQLSELGVARSDLVSFLGGSNVQTKL
ncbi:MAG TPA: hypothetical protein VFK02_10675 [Kofleriaceae bacterium]|nr:hypothetical protein [Kofleriaceae bacterium]